jgi:MYXO-CTERM domain-containing protein
VDDGTEVERGTDPLDPSDDFPCGVDEECDTGALGEYKGGWGGCACSADASSRGAGLAWLLASLSGLVIARRRSR